MNGITMKVSNVPLFQRIKYFLLDNWKKLLIALAIVVTFFVSMTFCGFLDGDYSDNRFGLGSFVVSMYEDIYGGNSIDELSRELNITVSDSGIAIGEKVLSFGSVLVNINEILVGVGSAILTLFFLSSTLTAIINQHDYAQILIKKFFVFIISLAFLYNAQTICQEFCNVGSSLTNVIAEGVSMDIPTVNEDTVNALWDEMNGVDETIEPEEEAEADEDKNLIVMMLEALLSFIKWIFGPIGKAIKVFVLNPLTYMVVLLIPWAGVKLATALCTVFVWTRGIEIAVLCALSPIPFAIMTNDPFGNGTGARFLKNIAALSIQGAVMMLIFIICNSMVTGIAGGSVSISELNNGLFDVLVICFAEAGLLMKSLSISQKLVGIA